MGLRCLVGHDFGDRLTEREREERGDEVVVTVREYRECSRCGERRIISENKEVTADRDRAPDLEDAERETAAEPEAAPVTTGSSSAEYEEMSAEEDDGVILDDENPDDADPAVPARAHGEWPSREEADPPEEEPRAWPDAAGEDEGFDAEPGDGRPADVVEFRGGLTPERHPDASVSTGDELVDEPSAGDASDTEAGPDPDESASEPSGPPAATTDDRPDRDQPTAPESSTTPATGPGTDLTPSGITSATPSPTPTGQQRTAEGESEFVCPECGHTARSQGSSLRPGDICPECRRGYLTERER